MSDAQYTAAIIAKHFVKSYYTKLVEDPDSLNALYSDDSVYGRCSVGAEEVEAVGSANIQARIKGLDAADRGKVAIDFLDAQFSTQKAVLVIVHGTQASSGPRGDRSFVQTFLLAPIGENVPGFYVRNDILRYKSPGSAVPPSAAPGHVAPGAATSAAAAAATTAAAAAAAAARGDASVSGGKSPRPASPPRSGAASPRGAVAASPRSVGASSPRGAGASAPASGDASKAAVAAPASAPAAAAAASAGDSADGAKPGGGKGTSRAGAKSSAGRRDAPASSESKRTEESASWSTRLFGSAMSATGDAAGSPRAAGASGSGSVAAPASAASAAGAGAGGGAPAAAAPSSSADGGVSGPAAGGASENGAAPKRESVGHRGPRNSPPIPNEDQIFVGAYPDDTTGEDIRATFSAFGEIREVTMKPGKNYCFVAFKGPQGVEASLAGKVLLKGREIKVDRLRPQESRSAPRGAPLARGDRPSGRGGSERPPRGERSAGRGGSSRGDRAERPPRPERAPRGGGGDAAAPADADASGGADGDDFQTVQRGKAKRPPRPANSFNEGGPRRSAAGNSDRGSSAARK